MVEVIECPVCKNNNLQALLHCVDYTVSHETFSIKKCTQCELAITTPRPDDDKLGSYYESAEYISHSGKTSGLGMIYRLVRSYALSWKASLIYTYNSKGSILDFGCGTGEFLKAFQKKGWDITGIEPTDTARIKAENLNAQTIYSSLGQIPEKKYDVITAWHVIEHVPSFNDTILKFRGLLKKDGTIFIAVPNYNSPDANSYQEHWAAYDVPRHLWHFSKKSMNVLLESNHLKPVAVVPMMIDAFYVSMLSEKYRNGNKLTLLSLIKGFIAGLKSNFSARKNINHSSLIYIVKNS